MEQADATADQINAASAADTPPMPAPLGTTIQLLRGLYVEEHDAWYTAAEVRELNGRDEEYLAARTDSPYQDYVTSVLARGLVNIGPVPASEETVNTLILPDRNVLFLGIIRATYGKEREISVVCPECSTEQTVVIELDNDFPILGEGGDYQSPVEVELSSGIARFNRPNGRHTSHAAANSTTVPEMNTQMLAQCVITKDTTSLEERLAWARDLSVPDRKKASRAVSQSVLNLGPQLGEVETQCVACNIDMPIPLDWVSLLLS